MTGWGEAERECPEGTLRVEVRSVNHRYLQIRLRMPDAAERHGPAVEGWLKERLSRGHVTYSLSWTPGADDGSDETEALDRERARSRVRALRRLHEELGLEGPGPTLSDLVAFPEIFRAPEGPDAAGPSVDPDRLREVTEEAVERLVAHREDEGRRLADDLELRLEAMERALAVVEERAPERLVAERDRLRERVRELAEAEDVDEDRLAREIAHLAEKWDVHEEVVRYRSHVELFREALASEPDEPVGKRLSFVVQEMHREANTIGAKANDAEMQRAAVSLKEEVERLREQVENVE